MFGKVGLFGICVFDIFEVVFDFDCYVNELDDGCYEVNGSGGFYCLGFLIEVFIFDVVKWEVGLFFWGVGNGCRWCVV